jgi:hypothetical protein
VQQLGLLQQQLAAVLQLRPAQQGHSVRLQLHPLQQQRPQEQQQGLQGGALWLTGMLMTRMVLGTCVISFWILAGVTAGSCPLQQ